MRISERLLTVLACCFLAAAIPAHASGKGERELKQAQTLVDGKQYTQAMKLIVEIMETYPDLREAADKLVARVMAVRKQFNEKYGELVQILNQEAIEERDVEKGLAIVDELRELDPNLDTALDASLKIAVRILQEQGQFRSFGYVMRKAAGEIADAKYAEAIETYLGGFSVSRAAFDAADYPQLLRDQAKSTVANLETVSRQAAAVQPELKGLPDALEALLNKPLTDAAREGFLTTLQPLLTARGLEAQIRTIAVTVREVNAKIDIANGDKAPNDLWLSFVEQYALGRPDAPPEGLAFAVRKPWTDAARKMSDTAYAAADAAYVAMDKALTDNVDPAAFSTLAAEARGRGLLALGVLDVEASAWQPAAGLVLSEADRNRAADLPLRIGLIRQRMADAEALEAFIAAEAEAGRTLADMGNRIKQVPSPTGTDANELESGRTALVAIIKSAGNGEADWSKRAANATPGSTMATRAAQVRDRFSDLAARARAADAGLAARIAGLEAEGFEPRRVDAEARQVKGRALSAGTLVGQESVGKRPDLANDEYAHALSDIDGLLSDLGAWRARWTSEPDHVTASAGITRLVAEQDDLRARVVALQTAIAADAAAAKTAVALATQLRGQGESAFQAGQVEEKQKKYVEALRSFTTAHDSYTDSLTHQENAAARTRLEELPKILSRVTEEARGQNLAEVQALIDKAVKQYTDRDYQGAIDTFQVARALWEAAAGGENTTIEIYDDRAKAALKVAGKQEITKTDPIYQDIRGFMTQAELSYNKADSLRNTASSSEEYRNAIDTSRASVQAITAVVPEYREARLLALKIDRLELGTDKFATELLKRVDASLADAKNANAGEITWKDAYFSLKAYRTLEGSDRIISPAKRREIDAEIDDLEVKLGLVPPPPDKTAVARSTTYYQQALAKYRVNVKDEIQWEDALWPLQLSLNAYPLNRDSQKLLAEIVLKRGTSVDVLSPAELDQYRAALTDFLNRNYARSEIRVDELLLAKPKNPLLLDLKKKIQATR